MKGTMLGDSVASKTSELLITGVITSRLSMEVDGFLVNGVESVPNTSNLSDIKI